MSDVPPESTPRRADSETRAAWLLVKQWAADALTCLELEKELSSLGTYLHNEWKETFKKVEIASDPTEEHPVSAIDIVIEEARARGISLVQETHVDATADSSSSARSSRTPRRSPHKPRRSRKRRKLSITKYLDLRASEGDEDDSLESDDEVVVDIARLRGVGRAGLQSFSADLQDIAQRYGPDARSSSSSLEVETSEIRCYFMDFYSVYTTRHICDSLKSRFSGVSICPWLPRRLYVQASCPLEILSAMNPVHRNAVRAVTLVPPAEASRIFTPEKTFPPRSWVRIRKGRYKNDIGYVLSYDQDTFSVLVVPRERAYESPEEPRNVRALFHFQLAHDAGLDLTLLTNSRGLTAFQHNNHSYFSGLLRLSLTIDDLECVPIPHPDEIHLHAQAGMDPSLVEECHVLFSAQFWREGDVVRSSSPELLDQKATIAAVDLDNRSVTLILNDQTYDCPLLEQRRVFSTGDHLRITVGPDRGLKGMVTVVMEKELVLCSSTDLSGKVEVSSFFVETYCPDHHWAQNEPTLPHFSPSEPVQRDIQPGDVARVLEGPHRGLRGCIDWIAGDIVWIVVSDDPNDTQMEDQDFEGLGPRLAEVHISKIVFRPVHGLLVFTKEKGYDVGVGDEVRVARGPHWGHQGLVTGLRWAEAHLDVVFHDGVTVRTFSFSLSLNITYTFVRP
ncbi:hypothetical protein J3R83DRAFT_9929 [Lanmaoa asiatica]|nr:hypothetical protein J3R83DRAFT_9929 [Lanmaoa asiatica]